MSARRAWRRAAWCIGLLPVPMLIAGVLARFGLLWHTWLLAVYWLVPVLAMLVMVVGLLFLVPRETRVGASVAIAAAPLAVLVLWLTSVLFSWLQHTGWQYGVQRAAPIVAAMERFCSANGRLPEHLDELVPAYLEAMPSRVPPLRVGEPGSGRMLHAVLATELGPVHLEYSPARAGDPWSRGATRLDDDWLVWIDD